MDNNSSLSRINNLAIDIGVGMGSLVVIAVIVLILYRRKLLRKSACCAAEGPSDQRTNARRNTEGNTGDHHYEEINVQKQQESSMQSVRASVSPPAGMVHYATEDFQKDGNILSVTSKNAHNARVDCHKDGNKDPDTNKTSSTAMGQRATSPPADIVHYASVDFHKDGNKRPDTNMGQTAANPPAAETTFYSTVIRQGEQ